MPSAHEVAETEYLPLQIATAAESARRHRKLLNPQPFSLVISIRLLCGCFQAD